MKNGIINIDGSIRSYVQLKEMYDQNIAMMIAIQRAIKIIDFYNQFNLFDKGIKLPYKVIINGKFTHYEDINIVSYVLFDEDNNEISLSGYYDIFGNTLDFHFNEMIKNDCYDRLCWFDHENGQGEHFFEKELYDTLM